ncbi:MAG: ribbon-helix-helix domain-containing protein [Patescibacteria group bacterium]
MRQTMTISLPQDLLKDIERGVKERGYATKSEYVRDLVREKKEEEFMKLIEKNRKEFKSGKGKVLKSLEELF